MLNYQYKYNVFANLFVVYLNVVVHSDAMYDCYYFFILLFVYMVLYLFTGYTFPTLKEADAMFMAEKAPEWKDGECCHRCRVQFTTFQRKVSYTV